jgi:polyhydroxyalkanoate synthase
MAGATFRQLIVDLYQNNRLAEGTLMIRGERVDVGNIRANLMNVIAEADHISPPCQSEALMSKFGSQDKEVYRIPGGHIGIMAGSSAHKRTWPHIDAWLGKRSA